MIGQTISHYKILEKLGEGGMGIVYKAHDTKLDRMVALKFLPPRIGADEIETKRFMHEAKAASALDHPNICTFYEIAETSDNKPFIAMAYYEGETAKEKIKERPLAIEDAVSIAIAVAEGLAKAHEKGITHRDIKSDNIMLPKGGGVKIMDFGLARIIGGTKITKTGATIGTIPYMSPEQARGEQVDHRTDIWSLGVVMYEMVTGRLPFKSEYNEAVVYSILNEEPEPVTGLRTGVPMELERIVTKAMQKNAGERYQHVDEMLVDLRGERKRLEYAHAGYASTSLAPAARQKKKNLSRYLVPAIVLVVIILMLVIFNPFNFLISTQKSTAASEQNSIAVMYFENISDPQDQDKNARMITSLLTTGLSESRSLKVMSTQRLYDLLKQLGKEDAKVIDRGIASEVAKNAGVKLILTGEILQVKPTFVVTVEVSEADGGKILAAEKVAGSFGDDVFAVVDKMSANIRGRLISSQEERAEPVKAVADITTHSPEAYRYYLQGLDQYNKFYYPDAETSFKKALAIDSTYGMAYFWLAHVRILSESAPWLEKIYFQKALQYSDRVTKRERDRIKADEPLLVYNVPETIRRMRDYLNSYPDDKEVHLTLAGLYKDRQGEFQKAIQELAKAIELDTLYPQAYNELAHAYDFAGDVEKSLWAANKYISLAPDEADPYDTRAALYSRHGKLKEAINSYKKALSIKPDYHFSLNNLGDMYIYAKDFSKADSFYRALKASNDHRVSALGQSGLVGLAVYQGRFRDALAKADQFLTVQDGGQEFQRQRQLDFHWMRRGIFSMMKKFPAAVSEAEQYVRIEQQNNLEAPHYSRHWYVAVLAENGDLKKAGAVASELKKDIQSSDTTLISMYWWAVGWIERAKGNVTASLAAFQKSALNNFQYRRHFTLGRAYLEANMLGEAVSELEEQEVNYADANRIMSFGVQIYYYLGIAYEKSGWTRKAIGQYEEFLDILKNADKGIPEVEDAKLRLAKLRKKV